jgi:hypothetical protein
MRPPFPPLFFRSRVVSSDSPGHPLEPLLKGLGHDAFTRHDTLWCSAGRFSLITFPNNHRVACTKHDVQRLLVESGRLAAVFCPLAGTGPLVKEYRLTDAHYGLDHLQEQFRRHVRKHAGRFVTRAVAWEEMATAAAGIHADLAARRGIAMPALTDPRRWARVCDTAARIPGLTVDGCFTDGSLAAYVVVWQGPDALHGVLINRDTRFDRLRSANVLVYAFSLDRIGRAETSSINLGRGWYPPKPSLDSFKRHAGYEERETTVAVVLHPRLEKLVRGPWARRCSESLGRILGGRPGLASDLQLLDAARLTDIA